MKITSKTKVEVFAGNKKHVFEVYWKCDNCQARVGKYDNYCAECGVKFVGEIHG